MLALLFVASSSADWYSTSGHSIVNSAGKVVRLSGLNWFGYETNQQVFHGLWAGKLETIIDGVAERGFNAWRVPISAVVLNDWRAGKYNTDLGLNLNVNGDLEGLTNLDIFKKFLEIVKGKGHRVFIDIHGVTDGSYMDNLWFTAAHPPEFIYTGLEWFADYFKDDDTVVGIDIKNEPHGRCDNPDVAAHWDDSTDPNNWKHFIETAAARVLAKNPNLLILVEGIQCYINKEGKDINGWWGGNFVAVHDYPIDLGKYQKQLVYSPHEYGPSVSDQPWFYSGFSYDTLMEDHWKEQWFFIYEENIAPLLIGEWGGHVSGANTIWMKAIVQLIAKYGLSQTFWCLNPNSGDTGGLLDNDWTTWDNEKYQLIKPVLV
jgi:endoglucanase